MNILTVCGMGSGSSLILKMAVDEILSKHNIYADVEACDLGSIGGRPADLIITTEEFKSRLEDYPVDVVYVANAIDKKGIEEKLLEWFSKNK